MQICSTSSWAGSSLTLEGPATAFNGVKDRGRANGAVDARNLDPGVGLKDAFRSADSEVNAEGGTVRTAYLRRLSVLGNEVVDVRGSFGDS